MADYTEYKFELGKLFRQKKAENIGEYLETAEKIHGFLEKHKVETPDGIYWLENQDQENIDFSFSHGTAGLAYFYLELYKVTGKETYKDTALKAADYIGTYIKNPDGSNHTFGLKILENSLYHGYAGIAQCIYYIYETFRRPEDLETIRALTGILLSNIVKKGNTTYQQLEPLMTPEIKSAIENEQVVVWSSDAAMLLDGGIAVYLYKIYPLLKDPKILEVAVKATETILSGAINDPRGGLTWITHAHGGVKKVPNFELGAAGVGYLLTVAYEFTKKETYLEAAKQAAVHLRAIAVPQGDGYLIPYHDEPDEEQLFYVASCHGAGGTSKLFYQLYKLTGDASYLDDIRKLYKGIRHLGVPEKQSAGYWNTTCLCCGTAGILQFLIGYYLVTKDEEAKQVAITAGNILLGEQYPHCNCHAVAWPIGFERLHCDEITEPIAYWQGSTGNAGALLQLYLFLSGRFKWDRLFDDPYPAEAID